MTAVRGILLTVMLGLGTAACGAHGQQIPASGVINGHVINTTVDSAQAKYYLEDYLTGSGKDPDLDRALDSRLKDLSSDPPVKEEFRELSRAFSVDLATMHLVKVLSEAAHNSALQKKYWRESERLRGMPAGDPGRLRLCAADLPLVLFVPGWFYRSDPQTGADFAAQRTLLTDLGIPNQLVVTRENGTIEENARIVAEEIRRVGPAGRGIILVSASKGGPEAAHALGRLLAPHETAAVKAWINVGGILKGSPLADWASAWPTRWLVWLAASHRGRNISESLQSMTTARSLARWRRETLPETIRIVNFVGVPLSGHITADAEFAYARARHAGPTDGHTALIDELAHGGTTVLEVGLDHFYRDPEIDLKTVALGLTVMKEIGSLYDCPPVP